MSHEQKVQQQIHATKDQGSSEAEYNNGPSFPTITPSALNNSAKIDKIIPALAKAKRQFTIAAKDSNNPFYHSRYANLASIERAIAPALTENGLFLMQPTNPHEQVSGSVIVTITTVLWHESGQFLSSTADVPYMSSKGTNQKGGIQVDVHGMGSMLTYFRRYLKLAFLDIITDDDDGNRAMPQPIQRRAVQSQKAVEAKPTTQKIRQLEQDVQKLDEETQNILNSWLEELGLNSINELQNGLFQKIRLRVDQKLKEIDDSD